MAVTAGIVRVVDNGETLAVTTYTYVADIAGVASVRVSGATLAVVLPE